jgi:acetyl esterase
LILRGIVIVLAMAVAPQAQQFLDLVAGAPPLDTQTAEQNRADLRAALPGLAGPASPVAAVEDLTVSGPHGPVPVRAYRPDTATDLPVVIYLHGGGWVLGEADLFDTTVRDLARFSGAVVLNVDYRLAPEHPFPAAAEDAAAVAEAVLQGHVAGVDGSRLALAGDSAGGNLAAVTAQALRGEPALRHQALIYPATQARVGATGSYREFAEGYFLTARDMRYFLDCYAPGVNPDDPRLAPLAADDLAGLAPATVITAEYDPLRDEGEAYAHALREAGSPVILRRFPGLVHGFINMTAINPASHDALVEVAGGVRALLARAKERDTP